MRPGLVLALASVASVVFNMWAGRGLTFTSDELVWFMLGPDLDPSSVFQPYVGHLVATSKVLYKLIFETVGPEYWLVRLIACLVLVAVVWILFRLLRRYAGDWPALGISLIVLFFSGDPAHILNGNGITVLGSVMFGLLALLLLQERSTRRSVLASVSLLLGVMTYSQALPFLVGVTVFLLAARRFRDLWVPAIPFFLYFGWWIWARDFPAASQNAIEPERIYELPVWGFRATGALAGYVVRLPPSIDTDFRTAVGLAMAAVLVGLLAWLIRRGRVNPLFLAGSATLLTMWSLVIVVPITDRDFNTPRYMYPFLVASALVWGSMLTPRWKNRNLAIVAGLLVTVCCVGGAYSRARHANEQRQGAVLNMRTGLAGIEAVRTTDRSLDADTIATQQQNFVLNLPFRAIDDLGFPSLALYTKAIDAYGTVGYSAEQVREKGVKAMRLADITAYRAAQLGLPRQIGNSDAVRCPDPDVLPIGSPGRPLPPGTFRVINTTNRPGTLLATRFNPDGFKLATIPPGSGVTLGSSANQGDAGFQLKARGVPLRLCLLGSDNQ